ncbi:integrase-like protein [Lachnotalea glycerini]|uniref:Integrase-like protein n=1 Tax=Lachnotalea glycerini TaxID=1763509 RepID=A0A318EW66_9FIRM|nr:N-terminal phage integrase SAM-like domain-containing protein [Lachnotalea glycerini]PXV90236.1 integrase-like protein [Lachnotalea glycerini]
MINGKKSDELSLRELEKQIDRDIDDGIRTMESNKITLNDMFESYMETKRNLKMSTRSNYIYMWEKYIKDSTIGNRPLAKIRKSDVIRFYTSLLDAGFKTNSLETIHTIMHPTLSMAVDDDIIRKNPSDGVLQALDKTESKPDFVFTNRFDKPHNPMCINRAIKRIYTAFNEQEKQQAKEEHRTPALLHHFIAHIGIHFVLLLRE